MSDNKVFLGGTVACEDPLYGYRGELIPKLKVDYYNPVRSDWGPEALDEEYRQKYIVCNMSLFVITPEQKGFLSFAEVGDMVNKKPTGTIFCILDEKIGDSEFTKGDLNSLKTVADLVLRNGGKYFTTLDECADYINNYNMGTEVTVNDR